MDFSSITTTQVLISAITFLLCYFAWSIRNTYRFFEERGLKGPKPLPILGNIVSLMTEEQSVLQTRWVREYGKTFGMFFGLKPRLFVADPELMIQICVKDFDAFPNHVQNLMHDKFQRNFLVFLKDDHWRKVRALMSPTFTSGKIRKMFKLLDRCADDIVECFDDQLKPEDGSEEKRSAVLNGKEIYSLYTMDAIATCCYGLRLQRPKGHTKLETLANRDEFVQKCLKIFTVNKLKFIIALLVPRWIAKSVGASLLANQHMKPLADMVKVLIDKRRKSDRKLDDYLQLLVDAKLDTDLGLEQSDLQENHHAGLSQESLTEDQRKLVERVTNAESPGDKTVLSEIEILSSAVFLLVVGLETTGTLLTHASYCLAFHQDVQDRLYREISAIANYNEDKTKYIFDYDQLTSCEYLDSVLSETLRCIPAISLFDREASKDYHIEKYNITIPKGTGVSLGYLALLKDPDYWEEPEKFNPDRFMPGNREKIIPGAYCPFGMGPRHCLGMRFSLTESKLALAKLIMNFKMDPAPGTTFPAPCRLLLGLNVLANPLFKISPRN